ncbi:ABC transporter permease [Dinghuibacter silviterrae]|uniref:ABC-2 type transport system permease protein n=1 Tax=Dinghuibacter silviterrae TaxID=1539049 RepID=A0A4R8DEY0_9BACT|nr:ABC transporter permease [Dinghuibacter silviterrae]TDW96129.1 ABC-2 type transport system permease protein [Dinghuibacter silviterrae]
MKQLIVFVQKEFLHVFRDRKTLLMLFGLPIAQIVLFGFALSNEIKNSKIVVADYSKDPVTTELTQEIGSSRYFKVTRALESADQIDAAFKRGDIKMAVVFPAHFSDDLTHTGTATLQVIADASDPNQATTVTNYLTEIVGSYNAGLAQASGQPLQIGTQVRMLYNPELKGAPNFVPGVMALVLMLVCTMMTSVAIVREKELGTMEILLVSPFKTVYIIISKLMPNLIISIINLFIILALSDVFLDLPVKGSVWLLLLASFFFILTSLSIGLLLSINAKTQQAAMMNSLMGMMLPTMLLTGFLFPIENMPLPLQWLSNLVPSRWYFIIVKRVMLKGLGFATVWKETLILAGMSLALLTISLRRFKTRLQ